MPVLPGGSNGAAQPRIRIDNVADRETVYQRLLIVQGFIEGSANARDTLLVRPLPSYPSNVWQVNHGHFKALVPLASGPNELVFQLHLGDYQHASQISSRPAAEAPLSIWYQRDRGAQTVQLAILVGRDSPALGPPRRPSQPPANGTERQRRRSSGQFASKLLKFAKKVSEAVATDDMRATATVQDPDRALVDAPRGRQREQLRQLDEVKRRMALQAYLWQAFHAEQMRRMGLGRRTFALDDGGLDGQPGQRDISVLPKIHVLVSNRTVREIRDPDNAQQNQKARNSGAQHVYAGECLRDPSKCPREIQADPTAPIACLTLDTMWDAKMGLLRGHAALGCADPGGLSWGVMGSHWLWAAPTSLDQVTAAFQNEEKTDTDCCVNDLSECGCAFETLNVGSGAFMHELGHAFNNPHWPSGLMARGYTQFNRAFMTAEGTRTKGSGNVNPITPNMDSTVNHLHPAQGMRARWHPAFILPSDPPLPYATIGDAAAWRRWKEAEPSWEPSESGARFTSSVGIGALEIEVDDKWQASVNYTGLPGGQQPPQEVTLSMADVLQALKLSQPPTGRISITLLACNMRQARINDFKAQAFAYRQQVSGVPFPVTKGMHVGMPDASQTHWLHVFRHLYEPNVQLTGIRIYSGAALDGLTICYSDGKDVVLGGTGGHSAQLQMGSGDQISALEVRSGAWLDAVDIVLASGRRSGLQGGTGGGVRTLNAPAGQRIVGLYGSHVQWLHSLGLVLASV